ncbi:MAG: ATP-dependent helicase [bacterium]|nr:ATP-dependent helicase [bacterium]
MKKLVLRQTSVQSGGGAHPYRIDYDSLLNPAQMQAVMHNNGPALVLAGAGTGKTRTLTYRVARLVEDGVDPASILLLTFTRKASQEMLRRASSLLDGRCERVSGGTFHSFANKVLRRFSGSIAMRSPFTVLDQSDAQDVMNLVRANFDVAKLKKRFPQKSTLQAMYSKSVNTGQPLVDVIAKDYSSYIEEAERIAEVIRAYSAYKTQNGMVDYDDLLLHLLALTNHEEIGPILRKQFAHVMVDEYQDINALQHAIVKGLVGERGNVLVVGDDAQSIYAFRGADIKNIHAFPESFPGCKLIRLEHNYRSTQPVLDVCNAVLRDAPGMYVKELFSDRKEGEQPMLISCLNERQQSVFVVEQILELRENGTPLKAIAVLIRSGFLSFDLEIELGKANIPFRKFGGLRFAEAAHIKDVLAFLRLTVNPRDAISWYRALLLQDGVGAKTAANVLEMLLASADPYHTDIVQSKSRASKVVAQVIEEIKRASAITSAGDRARELAAWYKPTMERAYDDHVKRWKDIESLLAICSRYSSVETFLSDIALEPPSETLDEIDRDDGEDEFVTISTIHSAKGLEWNTVMLIWANEGRIPSARSAESEASLEEERRLLYVACTRAKERLILTYPAVMFEWEHTDVVGRPSRFLDNVDKDMLPTFLLAEDN